VRLEQAEQQALAYSRQRRLVDTSNAAGNGASTGPQSLLSAQLVQLNQAYSTAVSERIAAEQRWQRIRSLPDMKIPEVLANQAVQGLQQERARAAATYSQIVSTRQPDYPTAVESAEQRRELDRQISSIARNVRDSVESQYRIALSEENRLSREIEQIKTDTLNEQRAGIQLSILRRAADTSQQQYDSLLRRYNALNAEAGVQTNNLNIVDRASIVEIPSWPRLPLLLALAIFAGLLFSFVFVVLREQLFDAIRAPGDITDRLHLPLLGSVPRTEDLQEDLADPKSSLSEALNSVRTALALSEKGMPRSILFTSTQASEGKSSSCHALGRSITRLGKRVIIVDADLRRPNAHRFFDAKNEVGLTHVLGGIVPLEDAIYAPDGDRVLHLLPAGEVPPNPSELVTSPQFLKLVSRLSESYDVVLVDSAPVLGIADAVILANEVEATVFVIEAGRNSVRAVGNALARLRQGGSVNLAGALLTKYDPGQFGYGYSDAHAYQYSYKA
jgi:capsular exopolysaccharide synthesis family protein